MLLSGCTHRFLAFGLEVLKLLPVFGYLGSKRLDSFESLFLLGGDELPLCHVIVIIDGP